MGLLPAKCMYFKNFPQNLQCRCLKHTGMVASTAGGSKSRSSGFWRYLRFFTCQNEEPDSMSAALTKGGFLGILVNVVLEVVLDVVLERLFPGSHLVAPDLLQVCVGEHLRRRAHDEVTGLEELRAYGRQLYVRPIANP